MISCIKKYSAFLLALILLAGSGTVVFSQSINTEFGKNRVQYHDDFSDWWQYESQNFVTYWYGKSRNIALATIQIAEKDHAEIQKLLEHRINDKIEIIVYLDISDLKQSNIGTEETFVNKTGETKIIGNKMFVYFDGNHQNLRLKIREGIARVYFNHMLFGSSFQEIVQNALLMNIPDWFKTGIVSYAATPWDMRIEDEMRNAWLTQENVRDFRKFSGQNPRLAGHSFWFFIEQNYGKSSISNILYLTKISRGIENSFLYVFNEDINQVFNQWRKFYTEYFAREEGLFTDEGIQEIRKLRKKKEVPVSQLLFNYDGTKLAYIQNDRGKARLMVREVPAGKDRKIFSTGFVNDFQETDYSYPNFSWFPEKNKIIVCYEKKDVIKIRIIDIEKRQYVEQIIPERIQKIFSVSALSDDEFIFSALIDGQNDLVRYRYKTRTVDNITNDVYNDLDVSVCNYKETKGILFSSNRPIENMIPSKNDTILPLDNFKPFFQPLEGMHKEMVSLFSIEPGYNIRYPYMSDGQELLFLSSSRGVINIESYDPELGTMKYFTDAGKNILQFHFSQVAKIFVSTYKRGKEYKISFVPFTEEGLQKVSTAPWHEKNKVGQTFADQTEKQQETALRSIPQELLFQSPFSEKTTFPFFPIAVESNEKAKAAPTPLKINTQNEPTIISFNPSRITPANKRFSLQKVTTKFDNDILFEGLESYTGDRQQLLGTPMGFLMKANVKDLFEDYSIDLGMRLPVLLNGSEFFLVFDNKKSLIDKRFALYRRSQAYNGQENGQPVSIAPSRTNKVSTLGMYQWRIPFNIYKSFRITSQLRFDKFIKKSTENASFNTPAITEQRISLRGEYIYDNIHEESQNIKFGTRYKIYAEAINTFNIRLIDGFEFDLSRGFTTILGFDARHYIPVMKKSVLALRSAGATSFGSDKMLYYIGGMENWLFPRFNSDIPQRTDLNFAYKANIGQMRGFQNNIRNGTSYVLVNTELRVPFMQYLLGKNKGSAFIRNMQVTGFFDMGLAWYGATPYSKENPLNAVTLESPPIIRLEVEYFKDPAVFGIGWGFRTQIFGYFIKFDYAWGIETGAIQKPLYYLSLGQDF